MAAKGKAAKSATGASMSKYDDNLIHFLKVQFPKQFKYYSD